MNRAMLDAAAPETPSVAEVIYLEADDWEALLRDGRAALARDAGLVARAQDELSFDDPINIQYTSGTTGSPKGATLSHHSVLNNGFSIGEILGYTEQDRVCVPVPFYHCFGMVIGNLTATTHGAAVVVPARAFEANATLRAMAGESCTVVMGVPTIELAGMLAIEARTEEIGRSSAGLVRQAS